MSIQTELELATKKMIKEIDGFVYEKKEIKLAKLTENNVAIVEAMIRNDSAYIKSRKMETLYMEVLQLIGCQN